MSQIIIIPGREPPPGPSLLIKAIGNTGSNNDQSYAIVVDDPGGNIYITGYQHVSGGSSNHDITTVRYSRHGDLLWQRSISAASSTADGTSIDVDSAGNVYVGANDPIGFAPQGGGTNITKYDPGGNLQWSRRIKDPSRPMYGALGLKIDPASGDIFHIGAISGGAFGVPSQVGYVQRMNSLTGNVIWTRKYGSGINNSDEVNGLAIDSNGDLCIAGSTRNDGPNTSGGNSSNAMVLKYDDSGALQWSKYLGKVHSNNESFAAVAVDGSDNIFCGGWTGTSSPNIRGLVAKFNSSGALQWQREIGSGSDDHRIEGVQVDSVGNLFVMGRTVSGAGDNYFIIKLNGSTGASIWARRLGGGGTDLGFGAAIDSSDNIYVTGKTGLGTTFPALGANDNMMMAKLPGDGSGTGTYSVITYGSYSPGNIAGTSTTGDITVLTDQNYGAVNDFPTTLVEVPSTMIDVTVAP